MEEKNKNNGERLDAAGQERVEVSLLISEANCRAIFDAANDAIFIHNMETGEIYDANRKASEMYGYSREEMRRLNVEAISSGAPGYTQDDALQRIRRAAEGEPQLFEWPAKNRSGRLFWVEVNLKRAVIGGRGCLLAIVRDITERKKAEEELEQAMEELKRSNEELEKFAYIASHDLQQPLLVVDGFLKLLQRRYRDRLDPDAHSFIESAVDGVTQMHDLIRDLLEYARAGRGKDFEPVDCSTCLERAIMGLKVDIEESGAEITHDALPELMASPTHLTQLFQNLLGNAIKYRREETPRVHVSAAKKDGDWVFGVRDNGIGIAPEHTGRIFDIFQRLHGREEYPGTGIGLAVCKKIVERHGGRIWVESEPGRGSTFYFTVPDRKRRRL